MKNENLCKNCSHWKNKQSELGYSTFYGICTCYHWKFKISDNPDIKVLDRANKSGKSMNVHTFENQSNVVPFGQVERSQYCFVTNEEFGCINFKKYVK